MTPEDQERKEAISFLKTAPVKFFVNNGIKPSKMLTMSTIRLSTLASIYSRNNYCPQTIPSTDEEVARASLSLDQSWENLFTQEEIEEDFRAMIDFYQPDEKY